jgi:hypothetical protein
VHLKLASFRRLLAGWKAGGHEGALKMGKKGETVSKATTKKEQEFYVEVQGADERGDREMAWPVPFMPKFYELPEPTAQGEPRVLLQNLLHGYVQIEYDTIGKPSLSNTSAPNTSLS